MPAITLGYSQIEQQIQVIRRRRNWSTVQQAVYLCGGLMLLGIALLIILAVRGERLAFTIAFWAALASMLLSFIAAARLIWQRWIRPAETPRWIDRVAQLDDRLATLVAHHTAAQPPRLMATLVSQLFALRYRWEPTTLVPRRVPRSVYFFGAALIALIATSFVERPPATPQRFPHARTAVQHPNVPPDANGRVVRIQGQKAGGAEGMQDGEAGEGDPSAPGQPPHGSRARAGKDTGGAPAPGSQMRPAKGGQAGDKRDLPADADAAAPRDRPEPAIPDRLQDMIRQALRQPPLDHGQPRSGSDRLQAKGGKPQEQKGGSGDQQEQHAQADGLASHDQSLQRPNTVATPQQQPDGTDSGRGTNSGGGGGQGTSGIYGSQVPAVGKENASRTFELKLVLLGQSSRATMEPQKSKRGGVGDLGIPGEQPAADAPLNPNQRADEPLVRGEIPAEHEAMIKRIFSRAE